MDTFPPGVRFQLFVIVMIVFFTYIGQNMLNTVFAPLSRELDMPVWSVGLTISVAAVMVLSLSRRWGLASQTWGRKPVLVLALSFACVAASIFALTTWLRTNDFISAQVAVFGIVLARGVFFGAAVAAVPPTGQTFIAAVTKTEAQRVKGMSWFSASFNISIMSGSLMSAFLASWWLFAPVYFTFLMVFIALCIAIFGLQRTTVRTQKKDSVKISFFDPRVLPYILVAITMYLSNGIVQVIMGFLIQDRYNLLGEWTAFYTGLLMLSSALGAAFTQLVVVPILVWPPRRLIRVGVVLNLLALIVLTIPYLPLWALVIPLSVCGISMGFFGPGYSAGPTMEAEEKEFGSMTGVLSSIGGLTWIFGPLGGSVLYQLNPLAPFWMSICVLIGGVLLAFFHPRFKPRRVS